jgi:hypothetical protein
MAGIMTKAPPIPTREPKTPATRPVFVCWVLQETRDWEYGLAVYIYRQTDTRTHQCPRPCPRASNRSLVVAVKRALLVPTLVLG